MTRVLCHLGPRLADEIAAARPEVEVTVVAGDGDPATTGEVLLTSHLLADDLPAQLHRGVRWVHNLGTGVDRFPFDLLGPDQVLTCSRGASVGPISEWVLAQVLAFEKHLPEAWVTAPPERWNHAELGTLAGRHVGVVGYGGIGRAVARRALAFDSHVRVLRRRAVPVDEPGVEVASDIIDLAEWADHLVVAAPATSATRHLIDADVLAVMGPGAHLVNIARGSLVDQSALRPALDDGRLALASLDTVDPEPLPAGHWLYDHPRVHLTPHISWSSPAGHQRLVAVFLEELDRWTAGVPLHHVVDPAAGY